MTKIQLEYNLARPLTDSDAGAVAGVDSSPRPARQWKLRQQACKDATRSSSSNRCRTNSICAMCYF